MTKKRFLVVTDNHDIDQLIQHHFSNDQATEIHSTPSISQALTYVKKYSYWLLIIDLQLSGIDRAEMVKIFRFTKHMPILALTESLETGEKIDLLQAGVNAFLEKPIDVGLCSAQADALVELYLASDDIQSKCSPITFGSSMVITPRYRVVCINGEPVNFSPREYDLLYYFAKHPQQVFSRRQLYEQVWGKFYELGGDDAVKAHIKQLRKKLSMLGTNLDGVVNKGVL